MQEEYQASESRDVECEATRDVRDDDHASESSIQPRDDGYVDLMAILEAASSDSNFESGSEYAEDEVDVGRPVAESTGTDTVAARDPDEDVRSPHEEDQDP